MKMKDLREEALRMGYQSFDIDEHFVLKKESERELVLKNYKEYIIKNKNLYYSLEELEGKTLACWCYPKKCHGNILIELLNEKTNV